MTKRNEHMRLGRNSLCPCGSQKKFKHCCLRKVYSMPQLDPSSTFSMLPLTIQFMVSVSDQMASTEVAPFGPIVVMGKTVASVNFEPGTTKVEADQLLRIGFCNKEYRLLVQANTTYAVEELVANDILKAGTYLVVVVFDSREKKIKVFIDGEFKQEAELLGDIALRATDDFSFGHGGSGGYIWFCHVYQSGLSDVDALLKSFAPPPANTVDWIHFRGSINKTFLPTERADSALYQWFSEGYIYNSRTSKDDSPRILRMLGIDAGNGTLNDPAVRQLAATRVKDITDRLESVVNDQTKTEHDLLTLFRDCPALAFLLEPDVYRQWREQEIQKYGRIDFVFELVDGTFSVVEIESHTKLLFTQSDELTQPVRHAAEQVKSWIRGISKLPHVASRVFGSNEPDAFSGSVVIGRRSEITNDTRKERWLAEKQLQTWDDIIARGRQFEKRFNNPVVSEQEWEGQ